MASVKEAAKEAGVLVPKLMASMKGKFFVSENITPQQMVTILQINEIGPCKISRVACRMDVSAPTMTGLVDRLQRSGYVERVKDTEDRRIIYVRITKKGKKIVEQLKKAIQTRWEEVLGYLTDKEREDYIKILKTTLKALEKQEK